MPRIGKMLADIQFFSLFVSAASYRVASASRFYYSVSANSIISFNWTCNVNYKGIHCLLRSFQTWPSGKSQRIGYEIWNLQWCLPCVWHRLLLGDTCCRLRVKSLISLPTHSWWIQLGIPCCVHTSDSPGLVYTRRAGGEISHMFCLN